MQNKVADLTNLHTGLVERDAEPISILTVVLDQLLKRTEGGAACDEEPALIELPDAVVFYSVPIADCNNQLVMD